MINKDEGNNYTYVFAFLILTIATIPFRDLGWFGMDFTLAALHSALLISAVYSCRHKPKVFIIIGFLALSSIFATWEHSTLARTNVSLKLSLGIIFYIMFIYVILEDVLKQKKADRNMLLGSLSAFMLIGIAFAFIFALLEIKIPGSFHLPDSVNIPKNNEEALLGNFFYHSFVTLTTLGYGDIYPQTQAARFFCIIEAIIGQFYLVVIVAGIVGTTATKYFSSENNTP